MATGDEFFALLTERLPAVQVQGWLGRDGEELYRAIARVYETASDRSVAEVRAARVLLAPFAAKATGSVTVTWDAATTYPYTVPEGTVVARTSWGVEYVLTEDIVRTAGQEAGSAVYAVEARWAGFEANVDAGFVDWNLEGLPQSFDVADFFTGTSYLRSDGASGSYADASTNALARVFFAGIGAPVGTLSWWVRYDVASGPQELRLGDTSDSKPSILVGADGGDGPAVIDLFDDATTIGEIFGDSSPAPDTWRHRCITCDGTNLRFYEDGAEISSSPMTPLTGTWATTGDQFVAFDPAGGGNIFDLRQLAAWSRALTSGQVAAINTGGVGYDDRLVDGGGPDHWYPADGDSGTTVTDRGSAGDCNLTLHGGVSIETSGGTHHSELTDRIAAGTIRLTGGPFTGGSPGTLDLLARGAGLPVALGETEVQVRRKLRGAPDIVTPTGVRAAVVALLGTEDVTTVEPWDGTGFAIADSGFGDAAFMRGVWYAIVIVPNGTDIAVVQALVNRIRAFGYTVRVVESA